MRMIGTDRLGYVVRAGRVMARDPVAGVERVRGRLDRRTDAREFREVHRSVDDLYPIDPDWLQHLHEARGWQWPCPSLPEGIAIRDEVMSRFAVLGLPERYAGWCDGWPSFTKAAWCLVTHLKPRTVVETGVARGVTSRLVLEALARNGNGSLHSIDLPAIDPRLHPHIAIAVPEQLRDGWTLLNGSSRRRLPGLLAGLGEVDLFVHDSVHTGRNTLFEITSAWKVLRPGGAVLVDDVYQSLAFHKFAEAARPTWSCVGAEPDGSYRFAIALSEPATA
jgi:hypothetical protein